MIDNVSLKFLLCSRIGKSAIFLGRLLILVWSTSIDMRSMIIMSIHFFYYWNIVQNTSTVIRSLIIILTTKFCVLKIAQSPSFVPRSLVVIDITLFFQDLFCLKIVRHTSFVLRRLVTIDMISSFVESLSKALPFCTQKSCNYTYA